MGIIGLGSIFFIIIIVIVVLVLISCVKIVHQAQAVVLERLGGVSGDMEYRASL